jgi:hypothetical protein
MRIRSFLYVVFVCSLVSPAGVRADADQSSPKTAMKSFWLAIDQGDADAARKLCKYDDVQSKWIDGFATMCDGFNKLHDSGTKRFGPDAKVFAQHTPGYYAAQLVDKCTIQENGDTALVTPPGGKAHGTNMVKEDGKWILDLKSTMGDKLASATATYQAMGDASREVAKNMDDGKYASADEANADLRAKLKKAMTQSQAAGAKN